MRLKNLAYAMNMLSIMTLYGCMVFDPSNGSEEAAETWEKYDKAAEDATKNQQYDVAKKNCLRAIEEYEKNGRKANTSYRDLSKAYIMQGRYNEAAETESLYFTRIKDQLASHQIFWHYCSLEEIYQAQGKVDEARKAVEWLTENADKGVNDAQEGLKKIKGPIHNYHQVDLINASARKFWIAYPTIGNFYIEIGDYEKAIQYLKEHVDDCVKTKAISKDLAIAKNNLATAYYYAGDDAAAEKLFRDAGGLNANAIVGFPTDLAKSLTMLGRIAEHRGQGDQALRFYESACKSLHMYRTLVYKVEESDVWNQIGRFYVKQGQPVEAAKAYHEAITLRQATATQTHPNCADAIKGLADVATMQNELTSATLQATQSLKILDTALVPTHPRIAPSLVSLASLDILTDHPEAAAPLDARLETILQKPLGPWKEDFLETTAFYAGLLKKAGKPAEAGNLEQIAARQKDKR